VGDSSTHPSGSQAQSGGNRPFNMPKESEIESASPLKVHSKIDLSLFPLFISFIFCVSRSDF